MFEDWGELKSFRTGGVKTLELGAYRFGGGGCFRWRVQHLITYHGKRYS